MKVPNLPKVLHSCEVLWAVGTMFGAMQRVDMITTRKNKFWRFKVAVLNPNIVPTKMDVVTRFMEFKFEIEPCEPTLDVLQHNVRDDNGDDRNN